MKRLGLFLLFLGIIALILILINQFFGTEKFQNKKVEATHGEPLKSYTSKFKEDTLFEYLYHHRNSLHAPFGYPQDNDTLDDYIIEKPQYILSYCAEKNLPNWVAWELNETWVGDTPRKKGRFLIEPNLPDSFYTVTHDDYTHSGFDRGHLVRSKERTKTVEDNRSTFEMGNIVPQTPDLNRGVWLRFEDFCLNKALKEKKNMYIIAGGIFNDTTTLNDKGKVVIPDSCFKIVTFYDGIDVNVDFEFLETVSIAMPNTKGIRGDDWQKYVTTIPKIEKSTGYKFFPLLMN